MQRGRSLATAGNTTTRPAARGRLFYPLRRSRPSNG